MIQLLLYVQCMCNVQVVGCSGAVFGFMGLYVADMALNFRSLSFPWLRLIWIGATLAYFLVATITQASRSTGTSSFRAVIRKRGWLACSS